MPDTKHTPYAAAIANIHTTSLNSLANNSNSATSSTIDNSTDCHLFHDLVMNVAAIAANRTAGLYVAVFMLVAVDGTNFDTLSHELQFPVASFTCDAALAARQWTQRDVPVPPAHVQYFVRNASGQAFAASGNTLKYRAHSLRSE